MANTSEKLNELFGVEDAEVIEGKCLDKETGELVSTGSTDLITDEPKNTQPMIKSEEERKEDEEIKNDAREDFKLTRNRLRDLMDKGDELLDMAMRNVEMSEDPESIEGAASLIGNLAKMNKQLMDLHKNRQDIFMKTRTTNIINQALKGNGEGGKVELKQINQNVSFVGTSTDLAKLIADMKKEE